MRENGIKAQYMKRKMRATRDCDFSSRLTNILNRKLNPEQPNTLWCTGITYIWTSEEGFVYNKCNGFVFQENHRMESKPDDGNKRCIRMFRGSESKTQIRKASGHTQ